MKRWGTIRDGYMRSLRTTTGQGAKKKYMYSDYLSFLLKIAQKDDTVSNYSTPAPNSEDSEGLHNIHNVSSPASSIVEQDLNCTMESEIQNPKTQPLLEKKIPKKRQKRGEIGQY